MLDIARYWPIGLGIVWMFPTGLFLLGLADSLWRDRRCRRRPATPPMLGIYRGADVVSLEAVRAAHRAGADERAATARLRLVSGTDVTPAPRACPIDLDPGA